MAGDSTKPPGAPQPRRPSGPAAAGKGGRDGADVVDCAAAMRVPFFLSAATAALLLAGCASVPPPTGGEAALPAPPAVEEPPVSAPAPAEPVPEAAPEETPKEAPAEAAAARPAPEPKPWTFSFKHGSHAARIDGVLVYLGRPAKTDWKQRKTVPSELDRKFTVDPLEHARSKPLAPGRPLRVCLDPGHGGQDTGALSKDGRTVEKTLSLDIARRVARMLRLDGVEVSLTRPDDRTFVPLPDRPAIARAKKADLFVSIHLNANTETAPRGVETYVFPARGMESTTWDLSGGASEESGQWWPGNGTDRDNVQLGFCIQRRLVAASGLPDRGLRRARFVVVREARVPAALVECGYLTNPRDLAVLRSENGREKIARGIYEGIFDFAYGTMAPGLPPHEPGPPVTEIVVPAAPAPDGRAGALEFVAAPVPPWTPPEPALPTSDPGEDPATAEARTAALRAAGLLPE